MYSNVNYCAPVRERVYKILRDTAFAARRLILMRAPQ